MRRSASRQAGQRTRRRGGPRGARALAVGVAALVSACPAPQSLSPHASSLELYWRAYFDRAVGPAAAGYSYAVYHRGQAVAVGSAGVYRLGAGGLDGRGAPMTPHSVLQIASASKPITAVALLRELERRSIDPVTRFWPLLAPTFPGLVPAAGIDSITIAQLLTHRSGFPFGYIESPRLEQTRSAWRQPLVSTPGSTYRYSNINYSLARTLLEQLSGVSYEVYVREHILRPAGSTEMALRLPAGESTYVHALGDPVEAAFADDYTDDGGAYGWYATAPALGRVLWNIQRGAYLSDSMVARMLREGLGWGVVSTPSGSAAVHQGQWIVDNEPGRGVRSAVGLFPDSVAVVLLINTNGGFTATEIITRGYVEIMPRLWSVVSRGNASAVVRVERPPHAQHVACTTDGRDPTADSPPAPPVIRVALPAELRCRAFAGREPVSFVRALRLEVESR